MNRYLLRRFKSFVGEAYFSQEISAKAFIELTDYIERQSK